MSRNNCGTPASILFKHVTNENLIYEINRTVVMIGTMVDNQGLSKTIESLTAKGKDAI